MKKTTIPCPRCGVGQVRLPMRLEETLVQVRITPGFTIPELLDRFPGIGQAAVNKRLRELEALGFVRREQRGHAFKWFPK